MNEFDHSEENVIMKKLLHKKTLYTVDVEQ